MKKNIKNKQGETSNILKVIICLVLLLTVFLPIKEFIIKGSNEVLAYTKEECRYLSDIPYISEQSSVGWGSITLDRNLDAKYNNGLITLKIDGTPKSFRKGVAAHAESTLVYDISSYNLDRFVTYFGVDASRGNSGTGVKFSIYTSVDGTNWDLKTQVSPPVMKGGTDAQYVDIDIKGVKYLKLYANSNGNIDSDHAVYADARLMKERFELEEKNLDFIKTVEEYDQIIKTHDGEEIAGEYEFLLLQRTFVERVGYDNLVFFAQEDQNEETLRWLMTNVDNLRLYVMGGTPGAGDYYGSLEILSRLYEEYSSDFSDTTLLGNPTYPNMTYGELYKKMAMSIALTHTQTVGLWMQSGVEENRSEPLRRYAIFKYIHKNGWMKLSDSMDMTHLFEDLHIVEMRTVLVNNIDDEEILWLNRYVQDNVDNHPENVWRYQTPHPYIAYVWPNYANPVYFDPNNIDYFNELFAINKTADNSGKELGETNTGKVGIFDSEFTIPGGKNIQTYTLKVSRGTPEYKLCKVWMNFRNKFGTGCVCGGISKSGVNIRGTHGIPSRVIGQPGHAAILFYSKDTEGRGYWRIDNDVSGWTLSGGGGTLLGWGNSYTQGFYNGVYIELEQAAVNDYQNLIKAEEQVMLAKVYDSDLENEMTRKAALLKQEEIYKKALEIQNINFDAWLGLITVYNANEDKTEEDCYKLAEKIAENLEYFPLPMYNATSLLKTKLTSTAKNYEFTLLQTRTLIQASQLPNNTANSFTVMQPGVTRLEANYLLNNIDTTIATFSFDGEDAGKIVLSSRFDGSGVRWDYSLDGKQTWKEVDFTSEEEHKLKLSDEELNSITAENDIYVHIVGVNYEEKNLYKIDILEQGLPEVYNNDWENKVMGVTDVMEWRWEDSTEWKLFREEEPDLTGDKTIVVRAGKTGVYLISPEKTLTFTTDTNTPQKTYIPISHLSIHAVSTEATAQGRYATNAIDGNINTNWHSAWNGSDTQKYIIIKLDEPKHLTGLDYLPAGGGNGKINNAVISVSMDGEDWTEVVSETNWPYDMNMKSVEFEPTRARYIKIVGKVTQNSFMVVSMFNLYENTTAKTVAEFSFTGENAGKIVIDEAYKNQNWKYSIDSGANWKDANSGVYALSAEEIEQINGTDQISILFEGDETEYHIRIKEGVAPERGYLNDWENRVIGLKNVNTLEWKYSEDSNWTSYEEQEPVVKGSKTLLIRTKATGIYTASEATEYEFTADNYPETQVYIPIANLSIHGYSTQSTDSRRPHYAPNAIDGNINTEWHTDFSKSIAGTEAYIAIKLNEPKYISALGYAHMDSEKELYGYMKTGIVYVSSDGENWVEAARTENCEQDETMKKIVFNESIYGQYVKLVIESHDNVFATAAMINLYEDTTKIEKPVEDPIFKSDKYKIAESEISRIEEGTTVTKFKENVETNQELVFKDKNGNVLSEDGIITTGSTIQVGENSEFTLIVTGDINKDGLVTVTDLAQLKLHYVGKEVIEDNVRMKAADINEDGNISLTDIAQIKIKLVSK